MNLDPSRDRPEASLDLPPVDKHNWKSKAHRDRWSDTLGRFPGAFDRALEAALLDPDHPRSALCRTLDSETAIDLVARVSDDVDVVRETADGETTIALAAPSAAVPASALLNADRDAVEAQIARGVPECCARQYADHCEAGRTDPVAAVARDTPSTAQRGGELVVEEPHPVLNPAWSYRGWRFVDFYPCSFECEAARKVAAENGRLLREVGAGDAAEAAFDFLAAPTYWSGYHGLAHVKNRWSIGEYTTDDYWHEETVRFNGYHEAGGASDGC